MQIKTILKIKNTGQITKTGCYGRKWVAGGTIVGSRVDAR
jgi:hypothetical protein